MQEIHGRVRAILDRSLDLQVSSGLTSAEAAKAYRAQFKDYVPLRGYDGVETEGPAGIGMGFQVRGKESQQATGRRSRADSPIAYAFSQAVNTIIRAEKNRVGKTFLRLVENNPAPDFWQINRREMKTAVKGKTYLGVGPDGEPVMLTRDQAVQQNVGADRNSPNAFVVKVNGKEVIISVKNRDLVDGLKGLNADNVSTIVRGNGHITRFMSAMNTSFNPDWAIP
ncbi:MAG: hypothetical protein AAFU56_12110, partial [Pseudomonadota bacterium]